MSASDGFSLFRLSQSEWNKCVCVCVCVSSLRPFSLCSHFKQRDRNPITHTHTHTYTLTLQCGHHGNQPSSNNPFLAPHTQTHTHTHTPTHRLCGSGGVLVKSKTGESDRTEEEWEVKWRTKGGREGKEEEVRRRRRRRGWNRGEIEEEKGRRCQVIV